MRKQYLTNPYGAERLTTNIVQWGYDKGILKEEYLDMPQFTDEFKLYNIRTAQLKKTYEEVDELNEAIFSKNREEAMDAIGDIIVTLIMQAELWDTNIFECLEGAYDVISKRTGKMVDGQFVKDS